ncbi:hypothetical protein MNEG_12549 [Monoraphidium neglectum]|uniref:Uncharacterized protein n=1 Tax=Monoraphidium neglectum TaxID=145388 RepID=A0A0D2J6C9_9CHLO|nr:hypothetical protein MNEG_12549 [Monoraphidium neglectum]KIY95412.1 hypothetical protein MNEG_12549 [Monoraphidium neglectum]|eukprot:XP_013894432.1 hypothetical protein MNEG_12549 [Monoraphidium neglectum]
MTHSNDSPVWGLRPSAEPSIHGWTSRSQELRPPHEQLSLIVAQAKKHASVQRLAAHYEEWETSLRREAEERIGGFKPLQRFIEASGQTEDWQLLRRVKSQQPGLGGAMKRSASEGTLTLAEHQPRSAQRVHMRQDWEPLGSSGNMAAQATAVPHATPHEAPRERRRSADGDPAAAAPHISQGGSGDAPSPQAAQQQQQAHRFPRATTAPALRDEDGEESEASDDGGAPSATATRRGTRSSAPGGAPAAASAAWSASGGAGSPPDDLGARQLEAVAARLLQSSRAAIQTAHAAVAETAINCSQNLQTLGALFSASVGQGMSSAGGSSDSLALAGGGPDGGGDSGARGSGGGSQLQLVPWAANDRAAAAAAAAAAADAGGPWDLIPRYLRLTAEGLAGGPLAIGDAAGAAAAGGAAAGVAAAQQDGGAQPAVYRQLAEYFDRLEEERRRRRAARRGGAYSSLREPGRNVAIVTTASLPWMTGTAVNPLLRAAYLANEGEPATGDADGVTGGVTGGAGRRVTLLLPWLNKSDQERVFPGAVTFDSPTDQEAFVREWAQKRTGLPCDFAVKFYPGRYAPEKGSILPVGDITQYIPDSEADVAVLEEPEHVSTRLAMKPRQSLHWRR